jgi:hypothetical protein
MGCTTSRSRELAAEWGGSAAICYWTRELLCVKKVQVEQQDAAHVGAVEAVAPAKAAGSATKKRRLGRKKAAETDPDLAAATPAASNPRQTSIPDLAASPSPRTAADPPKPRQAQWPPSATDWAFHPGKTEAFTRQVITLQEKVM